MEFTLSLSLKDRAEEAGSIPVGQHIHDHGDVESVPSFTSTPVKPRSVRGGTYCVVNICEASPG